MTSTNATRTADPDEVPENWLDPLVPREIDLPTVLPLDGDLPAEVGDIAKIFAAPDDPTLWPEWRRALIIWRQRAHARWSYDSAAYEADDRTRWANTACSIALVWLWDERLFDHEEQRFDVDRYLRLTAAAGGFDAVVLWHAYPIIGIDDRNQFDFYRQPKVVGDVIDDFHARGIKVFLNYNPWDVGTRRPDNADETELAEITAELGADGMFLDTMKEGSTTLASAFAKVGLPCVLEGESRIPNARIADHRLSWAQWMADSKVPGVLRAHWFEQRHMMHHTRRWNRDHSDELQSAWMNGVGILFWDTVFGVWVGWNERDLGQLRALRTGYRVARELFADGEWTPLIDAAEGLHDQGLYVSRFERDGTALWTIINRSTTPVALQLGDLLNPWSDQPETNPNADRKWYDIFSGTELTRSSDLSIPARGLAGVIATFGGSTYEERLRQLHIEPPSVTPSTEFPARRANRINPPVSVLGAPDSAGSIAVRPGRHELTVRYRFRETGLYDETPYVEEWKPLPPRLHHDASTTLETTVGTVRVAVAEVSCADFAQFQRAAGVAVAQFNDPRAPATLVTLTEARSYAAWAGARLPTEHEWQLAASEPNWQRREPAVWNWTESEHTDGVTRFVILKGGADTQIAGSDWYFDQGRQAADFSAKYLMAGLGVEASTSIGFRLAWDTPVSTSSSPTE